MSLYTVHIGSLPWMAFADRFKGHFAEVHHRRSAALIEGFSRSCPFIPPRSYVSGQTGQAAQGRLSRSIAEEHDQPGEFPPALVSPSSDRVVMDHRDAGHVLPQTSTETPARRPTLCIKRNLGVAMRRAMRPVT